MQETLYHPEVYLPRWFTMPTGRVTLDYTRHALRAAKSDRYGEVPIFETVNLDNLSLVEMGAVGKTVTKIVVRGGYDTLRDHVLVLIPGEVYTVKTVWYNLRTDNHRTLRRDRYATHG